jgi:uncharacterized protein (DUF433 family)
MPGDEVLEDHLKIAFTRERAAQVAGLSVRQVTHWAETGIAAPSIVQQISRGKTVRLYDFAALMSLLVAAELRRADVPLAHIRAVVSHLNSRGYESPLTELVFATAGRQIHFQHPDGTWESGLRPDQLVIRQVLDLRPVRARIMAAVRREDTSVGQVERRRGALGGKPLIAGTRIPISTVERYLANGRTTAEIVAAFPALRPEEVESIRRGLSVA